MKSRIYLPYSKALNVNAKKLRNDMTEEEKKLWYQHLSRHPVRFIRQKIVGRFILDFYCAKCRLGIEIDGSQHYTEQGLGQDEERTKVLNAYGIEIIRFTNEQIQNNFLNVCSQIDETVGFR